MKENMFLKVTGILMIIGGVASILISILALIGAAAIAATVGDAGLIFIAGIISMIGAIVELIAGIKGVKGAKDPAKGAKCVGWGITVIVISLASLIINNVGGGEFSPASLIIGLAIPVLYTIGAFKAKKAAAAPVE